MHWKQPLHEINFVLGIKGLDTLPQEGTELLRYKTAINLLFQMILGNTSRNYLAMYNQGIIDDSFGFEFSLDREFHFADFSGDTDDQRKQQKKSKKSFLDSLMIRKCQKQISIC